MPTTTRSHPKIPDHEVLRKIGGGAYGEVWMARGVTGAMRAVKVVWREDFDDERTFEREFEGILKFEPISRDHPGLVNILHVGRSPDGVSFYYYVMELGDDAHSGQDINPVEYEARTLRAEGKAGLRHDAELCIDVGLRLAEALEHLHENGLAHRDVKPSNVIFVNGKAKLADIGLVAARDQRTFVGTEGFVPPEGPGSTQADVYSLGKVLYEIATGKDRLDFPELPEDIPAGSIRNRFLELNRIICEICEPRVGKRRITTASGLAESLRNLQRGRRHRSRVRATSLWTTAAILLGFAIWASYHSYRKSEFHSSAPDARTGPLAYGRYRITSSPEGAEVFNDDGESIGITNTSVLTATVGTELTFILRKDGYHQLRISAELTPASVTEPLLIFGELRNFTPPVIGGKWEDHHGVTYLPRGKEHVSENFVGKRLWREFLMSSKRNQKAVEYLRITGNGHPSDIVLAPKPEIIAFGDWVRAGGIRGGFLTRDHEVTEEIDTYFSHPGMSPRALREGLKPFRTIVRTYTYGAVQVSSDPPGAEVYLNGVNVGSTSKPPLLIPKVKPGGIDLLLVLEGFKPLTIEASVGEGENLPIHAVLEKNQGVVFGKPWRNSLGMAFVPLGPDLMASIWETRINDYQEYLRETKANRPRRPDFEQGGNHPVIYVSREDARAFCDWLTTRERSQERISASHRYRLPADREWSRMTGLDFEIGESPGQRDANKPPAYPWGNSWPPPDFYGNYADTTASDLPGITPGRVIAGYLDGHTRTAPVGSFAPNQLGIHDLSGNVQEWVSDDISAASPLGVVRGGGWNSYQRENLLQGWRNPVPPGFHGSYYGFRIVLSKSDPTPSPPKIN